MPLKCSASFCDNKQDSSLKNVSFFRFSKDGLLREKWIEFCRLIPNQNVKVNSRLCSLHFQYERDLYIATAGGKLLTAPGAVPSYDAVPALNQNEEVTNVENTEEVPYMTICNQQLLSPSCSNETIGTTITVYSNEQLESSIIPERLEKCWTNSFGYGMIGVLESSTVFVSRVAFTVRPEHSPQCFGKLFISHIKDISTTDYAAGGVKYWVFGDGNRSTID
ncbi:uncharacterized protein LOC134221402 [Armigeres subalbatus]|uniref:uncharacterized protein LOC134221402 n=1 Tax=Armigeres subalbatus TaxID=124917 RepID=UPI002ED26FA9